MNSLKTILREGAVHGRNSTPMIAARYAARANTRIRRNCPAGAGTLLGALQNAFPPARGRRPLHFDDGRYPAGQHRPRRGHPTGQRKCSAPSLLSLTKAAIHATQKPARSVGRSKSETSARNLRNLRSRGSVYALRREEIRSYRHLPRGWNSYDAEAPGQEAVSLALRFVDLLEKHSLKIQWNAPSVDDSVMMTVNAPSGTQEWEFFGDGTTAVMYWNAAGEKKYVDLETAGFERFLMR